MKNSRNVVFNFRRWTGMGLWLSFLAVLACEGMGWKGLREAGMLIKFRPVDAPSFNALLRGQGARKENGDFFLPKLKAAGLDKVQGSRERILFILEWVMNRVKTDQLDDAGSAIEAYQEAGQGQGLACGSMSRLFVAAARSAGFQARSIQLVRSVLNDKDTHVTAEVWLDGRWIVFDPTFNVSYRKGPNLLGAVDIRRSLLDGSEGDIHPVFYGKVAYPARLNTYYLDWLPLYNNLLILEEGSPLFLFKIPPFRYWKGPRFNYLETSPRGLWTFRWANGEYCFFAVFLPALVLFLAAAIVIFHAACLRVGPGSSGEPRL